MKKIKFNPEWNIIQRHWFLNVIKENNGYCPCSVEKTEETKCPCKEFRTNDEDVCHCMLYAKDEE